ncbi:MAG: zinc-binding dehydrogenase, partial [Candidatus Eisenbacteria bacterium]|nr:zinc-binding dehydrogenase [Candidatus Eisenbacteria bacterium]
LWPRFEAGAIRPIVHAILPVERAEEAHAILQRNENVGKVLLRIDAER